MKVMIAGATGQVGWRLRYVVSHIADTFAVGRKAMDLTRPDSIRETIRAIRPDVIINAAGRTHVDHAEAEQALTHTVNAVAPAVMAEEAKRVGALFVHYSSVYVFDGTKSAPYTELDAPNPVNEYGRSKLLGEEAITATGGTYLILRASWMFDVRARNFVLTMLRLARDRAELNVVDDQIGSPTWAQSLAEATCDLIREPEHAKAATGIYNLSALGSVSRYDFTQRMLDLTHGLRPGRPGARVNRIKTPDFPLPAQRPLNSTLDNRKVLDTFDVRLEPWDAQLRLCLAELKPAALLAA